MKHDSYVLIKWPEVQDFMSEDWFREEAIFTADEKAGDSAYFVPLSRYESLPKPKEFRCPECGSFEIQAKAWIDLNTKEFIEWTENEMDWCDNCMALIRAMPVLK